VPSLYGAFDVKLVITPPSLARVFGVKPAGYANIGPLPR
jgi:hypothetical protein